MYINNPGYVTKMAAMTIYGKHPSKIFWVDFNLTWHACRLGDREFYDVKINYEPGMTKTLINCTVVTS